MSRKQAERFQEALELVEQGGPVEGQMAPLVQTAHGLRLLASPPPPPPQGLVQGRQRLLAKAAQLHARQAALEARRGRMPRAMRLGFALAALFVVFGLFVGLGQVAAESLPGSPLYGLKLAAEKAHLTLTTDPKARADLLRTHAEKRLDEIIGLLNGKQPVDSTVVGRAEEQWALALAAVSQLGEADKSMALQRLAAAIGSRQQTLQTLAGADPEPPLRELLREMDRLRLEAHLGQGSSDGEQERRRLGEPSDPTVLPIPSRTPHPSRTQQRTAVPSMTPPPSETPHATARPSETPRASQTPQTSRTPARTAVPSETPQPSQTPHRTAEPSKTPPGPQTPASTAAPTSTPRGGGGGGKGNP